VDAAIDAPTGPFVLELTTTGGGTVAELAQVIDCGEDCDRTFSTPTTVMLVARPDPGVRFLGWSGDCTGTAVCSVHVDRVRRVAATFGACPALAAGPRAFGSGGEDELLAIAMEPGGDAIVAGSAHGDVGFGSVGGAYDAIVARVDPVGAIVWSRRFGARGIDSARAVVVLPGGDAIVAGSFEDDVAFDSTVLQAQGFEDVFIARLRGSDGAVVWARRFGGAYRDLGYGLALIGGDVAMVGQFAEPVAFGATILVATYLDGFAMRLDPADGSVRWAHAIASGGPELSSGDSLRAVAATADGDLAVVGTVRSPASTASGGATQFDGTLGVIAAKLDGATGAVLWSKLAGSQGDDHGLAVAAADDGAIYVGGMFGDLDGAFGGAVIHDLPGPNPWSAGAVARYDANGVHVWSRALAAPGLDEIRGLAATPAGVVAAGVFGRAADLGAGTMTPARLSRDAVVASIDSSGVVNWTRRLGGAGDDAANAVTIGADGEPRVVGRFERELDVCAPTLLASAGGGDGFLARVVATGASPVAEPLIAPDPRTQVPLVPAGGTCPVPAIPSNATVGGDPVFVSTPAGLDPQVNWANSIPAPADIDGDGDDDFVIALNGSFGSWGSVRVVKTTAGALADATAQVFGGDTVDQDFARDVAVFDANGDGKDDVLFAETGWDGPPFIGMNHGLIVTGPSGTMRDARYDAMPIELHFDHDVTHGDVDCDGDQDVGIMGDTLLINDGTGRFAHDEARRMPPDPDRLVQASLWTRLCDVDRDGDPDWIMGSGGQSQLHDLLLINDGRGVFARAPLSALPPKPLPFGAALAVVCEDYDRDGYNDIYIEHTVGYTQYTRSLWRNRGDGTFQDVTSQSVFPSAPAHVVIRAVDINRDGWLDLVGTSWLGPCGADASIYMNRGGRFEPFMLGTEAECRQVVPFDLDGDGGVDLLASRFGTGPNFAPLVFRNVTP
jgi:hypothetical protein